MSRSDRLRFISNAADVEYAAQALAQGAIVGQAVAQAYALTTRPDLEVVRELNLMMGRPAERAGSLTTTRALIPRLFDWSQLPAGLQPGLVLALIERLHGLGPFSFRAPAAAHLPDHLVTWRDGVRTALVVVPGRDCPTNPLIARAIDLLGIGYLHIAATRRDAMPDWITLQLTEADLARVEHPWHEPKSTTVVAFHRLGGPDAEGRAVLTVERDGTLPTRRLRPILADFGFGVERPAADVVALAEELLEQAASRAPLVCAEECHA
jgi:hypothetical protein